MLPERPNPEALLNRIQEEEQQQKRGKLKVFLGASPGVGKTYAMLEDARSKHAGGLDVIIGVVETHGRKEIEVSLPTFEILSPQIIDYRGKSLREFDLDAALRRRPQLILIDEMAHTNAPGLRHAKRWQDIKEILDNGIDVYTTLNIQHVESLNDTIAQITGVQVRETVPDSLLDTANAIELIDLPLDDLLKRLQDGKVYVPEQAGFALQHFFREGNLIALRELALRFTAAWVDRQVLLHRKEQKVEQAWPTAERLLVYVDANPESMKVIRAARRMASTLRAEWIVVYAEVPRLVRSEAQRNNAIHNLRLAEQLGAETLILSGFNIPQEIITLAHERNASKIVLGKQIRPWWKDFLYGSLLDELTRRSKDIDIYYITRGDHRISKPLKTMAPKRTLPWKAYGVAAGIFALTTGINFILAPHLAVSNLIMIYILGVVLVAMQGVLGPSIAISICSILAYDFFFMPLRLSFAVSSIQHAFTLVIMLFIAQIISHLTIITRRQAESAHLREKRTSALYALGRQLAESRGADQILSVAVRYVAELFDSEISALLFEKNRLVIRAGYYDNRKLDSKEESIAQWVFHTGKIAGMGTDTLPFSNAVYVPLLASRGPVGVLRIQPQDAERLLLPEQFHLLQTCANQIALTLEVDKLRRQTVRKKPLSK
jgi:two-component system sensor histidine kinase KdpD